MGDENINNSNLSFKTNTEARARGIGYKGGGGWNA
jgi:hypothetical protein